MAIPSLPPSNLSSSYVCYHILKVCSSIPTAVHVHKGRANFLFHTASGYIQQQWVFIETKKLIVMIVYSCSKIFYCWILPGDEIVKEYVPIPGVYKLLYSPLISRNIWTINTYIYICFYSPTEAFPLFMIYRPVR